MADQLATPDDLAKLLGVEVDDRVTMLVEIGTAVVQATVGQRLVEVADDSVTLAGSVRSWLRLPQRPVSAVASVTIDGAEVTDYKRFGADLFRRCGWAASNVEPSVVEVVYSHGYAADAQELQLARGAVLALMKGWADNTSGLKSERIDDYQVVYDEVAAQLEASPFLRSALRRQYGSPAGLVRIGGGP